MITVGTLKKILEEFPDDSPILSVFSEEDVRYMSKIDKINIIWKDKEENEIQTTALNLQFTPISEVISYYMFIPEYSRYNEESNGCHESNCCHRSSVESSEKEENKFTPSTLIEELEKENNLFKNRYNIDNSILKMIQLKLIKNFDSLTKAYEELLEHKNKCVFGKCLDAIICKE